MIVSMGLMAISFSCYLTLRTTAILVYVIACLVAAAEIFLFYTYNVRFTQATRVIWTYLHGISDVVAALYVSRGYFIFKWTGGIHGTDAIIGKKKREETLLGQTAIKIDKAVDDAMD